MSEMPHEPPTELQLELLGHAALALRYDGYALLIDPYESGGLGGRINYGPIRNQFDAVACTHAHEDHCAVEGLRGSPRLLEADDEVFGPFRVARATAWHDEYEGRRRGGGVSPLIVDVGGLRLVHLSDIGHGPGGELVSACGRVDVLCLPVGGTYTVGAAQAFEWVERLGPKVVLPMHYATQACELGLLGVEQFSAYFRPKNRASHLGQALGCVDDLGAARAGPQLLLRPMTHL